MVKEWSKKEDNFLKNNFMKMNRRQLAISLNRTLDSVNKRLDRYLKLNKKQQIKTEMICKRFGLLIVIKFV